jgi:hypothetical protein
MRLFDFTKRTWPVALCLKVAAVRDESCEGRQESDTNADGSGHTGLDKRMGGAP